MNEPVPLPSVVLLSLIVGFGFVLQQIPLAVTVELPSDVTLPPQVAVVAFIFVTSFVVTVGSTFLRVAKLFSSPYAVPYSFVA